jgi:hypothetical protein
MDLYFLSPSFGSFLRFISVSCHAVRPKRAQAKHKIMWKNIIWKKDYHDLLIMLILTLDMIRNFIRVVSDQVIARTP